MSFQSKQVVRDTKDIIIKMWTFWNSSFLIINNSQEINILFELKSLNNSIYRVFRRSAKDNVIFRLTEDYDLRRFELSRFHIA